jgi:hypothetical protein
MSSCRLPCLLLLSTIALSAGEANRLRNGSFEGALSYWYNTADATLVTDNAAAGRFALRVAKGGLQSAPFLLTDGQPVRISFSVKAEEPVEVGLSCFPSHREIAQREKLVWGKPLVTAKAGPAWTRVSATFTPRSPHDHWWPQPVYMVMIGAKKPFLIDAVTVVPDDGTAPDQGYVPRTPVEVLADTPDLRGYAVDGNLLARGATVNVRGTAHNPGASEQRLTLRWQLVDYEGRRTLGDPIDRQITLAAGATRQETVAMPLSANGLVLARVSALDASGAVIDRSDLPLTTLPYPKQATAADARERFGASFFGLKSAALGQRIGMRWSRWHPHLSWSTVQKENADTWHWPDARIDEMMALGYSVIATLYHRPDWAMVKDSPLPKDMLWAKDDARWNDLTPQTAYDRFLVDAVKRYAGKAVVFELENEPELAGWKDADVFARFTIRCARLIKATNPQARVLYNATWPGPTPFARNFFQRGGAKVIDVFTWHDYHEGWLGDARTISALRQALDENGGRHVEIEFNEGWTFTNTAVDEPALALGRQTAAESTNAMVASVAEVTAAGQDRTILFHLGYEQHGKSWWDFYGPGTLLWDFYGHPLPLVPAWNVLNHHVGLSTRLGLVRPLGANLCIFHDDRGDKGVIVAYADRGAKADASVTLPFGEVLVEDIMGNVTPLIGNVLTLPANGRPCFIHTRDRRSGKAMHDALAPLDRRTAGFVAAAGGNTVVRLPQVWDGTVKGAATGNPIAADGQPVWTISQVWPDDVQMSAHYRPLTWTGQQWTATEHSHGGQPGAKVIDGVYQASVRGPWGGNPGQKICALIFTAPKPGVWRVSGTARSDPWDGNAAHIDLRLLQKDTQRASEVQVIRLPRKQDVPFTADIRLGVNQELVLVPAVPTQNATNLVLRDVTVTSVGE